MRAPRRLPAALPVLLAALPALLAACGGGLDVPATPTATRVPVAAPASPARPTEAPPTPTVLVPTETPTEAPAAAIEPLATATEIPPEPTPTPEPEVPSAPVEAAVTFDPPELVQGGAVIVYLDAAATAATMTFGGNQYPMLFDGRRWWAITGVGAFAETGQAPVTIAYQPPDDLPQASVTASVPIVDREFPVENIELDPGTASLLQPEIVQNELAIRAAVFSGYTLQRLWSGSFVAPANGPISSTYGLGRSYNGGPVTDYHHGTDFAGETGTPVSAAAAGRVVFAQDLQVRGNTIIIDHGVGVFTAYNHLSAFAVAPGDMVEAGQVIGEIGSTGLVTGPHLHWEVVVRGVEVDGQLWLTQ